MRNLLLALVLAFTAGCSMIPTSIPPGPTVGDVTYYLSGTILFKVYGQEMTIPEYRFRTLWDENVECVADANSDGIRPTPRIIQFDDILWFRADSIKAGDRQLAGLHHNPEDPYQRERIIIERDDWTNWRVLKHEMLHALFGNRAGHPFDLPTERGTDAFGVCDPADWIYL